MLPPPYSPVCMGTLYRNVEMQSKASKHNKSRLFAATHFDSGSNFRVSSNITVIQPFLLEYDTMVYSLPDAIITLRCLPNDTRAPILWRQ